MQFQKLVWIRVHVALKQFKVAFAESSQECPCKPRSQFLPPHSTVHGVHFCTPAKQVLQAGVLIIVGRFKNDNGTENWPKRENSILFFRHPFGDENFLFGDYFINSHNLFP